jgi:uncharacterized protein (TIGR02996 family)
VTDLDAIHSAVLDRPDDDHPRLVYAECIEEQASDMPDPDDARARAEFIRVQVELARMPAGITAGTLMGYGPDGQLSPYNPDVVGMSYPIAVRAGAADGRYHDLRRRERELWEHPNGVGNAIAGPLDAIAYPQTAAPEWECRVRANGANYIVRRGFVDAITCDLPTWCGGECERCRGNRFVDAVNPPDDDIYWRRCPDCNATGRTTGIGPAVVRAHPVRRVVLTDREPWRDESSDDRPTTGWDFAWWRESAWGRSTNERNEVGNLPDDVFDMMSELHPAAILYPSGPPNHQHISFPTRAAALAALSAALIQWAKSAPVA